MAVRSGNVVRANSGSLSVVWSGLLNTDTGGGADVGSLKSMSVQAVGTFGVGGTVTMQGSNDGVTWGALPTALTMTDGALKTIAGGPRFIRPNITAGDGTTSLVVTLSGIN
jgi:hypothetical protein